MLSQMEGTDLIYEGITTFQGTLSLCSIYSKAEGTDLIYEGITTSVFVLVDPAFKKEGTDLIYEGITTGFAPAVLF
jgi:hypothetical protein